MNCMNKKDVLKLIYVLFLGQIVSFNLAVTSFTSSLLSNLGQSFIKFILFCNLLMLIDFSGVNTPLTQSFFTYLSLALVYTPILVSKRRKLLVPWYWYALLGFVDVVANYLVIEAYQFSSITSVTLLDCWTIPWVLILTWIFIGTRYSLGQFVGTAICIGGLFLVVLSDFQGGSSSSGKNPILGDSLVMLGTVGYAVSNVSEEYLVKKKDRVECVSMLAVFALIVGIIQISIFEKKKLEAVEWTPEIILLFVVFAMSTFMFYSIVPFVMKTSGSAMFNLSILTSDMWAVVVRLFFYHDKLNWLYFVAYAVVAIGLIIYSVTDKVVEVGDDDRNEYRVLLEENGIPGNDIVSNSKDEQLV